MAEWLPIETAPKDGTPIDLWVIFFGRGRRMVGCSWQKVTGEFYSNEGWYDPDWDDGEFLNKWDCKPTHWMPLPEPPEQG